MSEIRPFAWDDLDSLARLVQLCEVADNLGEATSSDKLKRQLSIPGRNPLETTAVIPTETGEIIASCGAWAVPGIVTDTVILSAYVDPAHRSREIYSSLLNKAEELGSRACVVSDRPAEFHASVNAGQGDWQSALEENGFAPVRWFIEMWRSLEGDLPDVSIPKGLRIVAFERDRDARAMKLALDEAFLDHWNALDISDEQFDHWLSSPRFRPDLTLVAYDSDGQPAAACIGAVRDEHNSRTGELEGAVNSLGVRRSYRSRGLGRALLAESFQRMRLAGLKSVSLDVDSENPTGATGLYESVGFRERRRSAIYGKPLVHVEPL